jgi:iron complex transport system permease protein
MKVTLDLSKLLAEQEITKDEYERLLKLSAKDTGSLAFDILFACGVVAVGGGLFALFPSSYTSIALGIVTGSLGIVMGLSTGVRWRILTTSSTLVGALLLGGGIIKISEGSAGSFLLVAAIFLVAGTAARSGLLISLAVLAISSCVGARTGYFHASYFLGIEEPLITILLFAVIAIATYQLSKVLSHHFSRLAIIGTRTSVFVVNFAFWVGSLWGDRVSERHMVVSGHVFSICWALALMATGIWGATQNRRWIINTVAVFGGIHFYTQWFEHLGASPGTIVIAGLLTIAGAVALKSWNNKLQRAT